MKSIDIKTSFKSDHSPVVISLESIVIDKRGPGFWKFNSSLLNDEDYCAYIKGIITKYREEYRDVNDRSVCWDLIKMEIRAHTISYSKTQAFLLRQYETEISKKIEKIESNLHSATDEATIGQYKYLQNQLEEIHDDRTRGIILRSKIKQIEFGDKNSKYFLNIEKNNYKTKHITKLLTDTDQEITSQDEILKYEMNFYKNLLSTKFRPGDREREKQSTDFFNGITLKLLSERSKIFCEKDLSINECKKAIEMLPPDKSPGCDGLNSNFYKFFWEDIKDLVFDSFQYSYISGVLSIDQRRGVLSLNPKKDKDIRYLKHWRPLTLLNTDYKILAKAMGSRMRTVLPEIINPDQVAYLKERFIGQNIRVVDDVLFFAHENDSDGIILCSDWEKAFDSIEWSFIYETLQAFGFGQNFIKWMKIMYNEISSCVTNNGYSSAFFKITRGIRQGCPLSAYLFILVAEVLAVSIRQEKNITGFKMGSKEIRSVHMADDATLFLDGPISLQRCLLLFRQFGKISGLGLNLSKSEALGLGKFSKLCKRKEKPYGLLWKERIIKSLGIEYSTDPEETITLNYKKKLTKIQSLINIWKPRNLTIKGKITVIKSIILPQLLYISSNLGVPEYFVKKVNTLVYHFLWGANMDKVKRNTVIGRVEQGGLKMIDIQSMIESQRVMWVKRFFKQGLSASWTLFLQVKSDNVFKVDVLSLFRCELHPENLCSQTWPLFYRQLLFSWFNLKYITSDYSDAWSIRRQSIVFNRNILIQNRYARGIYIKWFNAGIKQLNDLYDNKGIPLTIPELCQRHDVNIDILSYSTIINAVPVQWKKILKRSTVCPLAIKFEELPHFKTNTEPTPITLLTNRRVYWKLVDAIVEPPVSIHYWNQNFNLGDNDWKQILSTPYMVSFDSRVHSFAYKVFLRIFPCNWYVSKFNQNVSKICMFCDDNRVDDLIHYFYMCNVSQNVWQGLIQYINANMSISNANEIFCKRNVMLGLQQNVDSKETFNFLILYTKKFISLKKYEKCAYIHLSELLVYLKSQLYLNLAVAKNQNKSVKGQSQSKNKNLYVQEMDPLYSMLNK